MSLTSGLIYITFTGDESNGLLVSLPVTYPKVFEPHPKIYFMSCDTAKQ